MVKFKAVMRSSDSWEKEQLDGKTLGMPYNIQSDNIRYSLGPSYYAERQASSDSIREIVHLGIKDIARLLAGQRSFTRRQALSFVMANFSFVVSIPLRR